MADLPEPMQAYLIVLGVNAGGKAFGSVFSEADAELAERAAGQMNMEVIRVEGDELAALAADLPRGKLFASGNAFVPLMAMAKYERLKSLAEAVGTLSKPPKPEAATTPADGDNGGTGEPADGGGDASTDNHRLPSGWADLRVGDCVLCSEGDQQGWWEAVVVEIANEDDFEEARFTLSFRDFPGYAQQVRRRAEIALLPPAPPVE